MPIAYGFNCQCGAEYDLSPNTAESIKGFHCRRCGRYISTGFVPERYNENMKSDKEWLRNCKKDDPTVRFCYRWRTSGEPGHCKRAELLLKETSPHQYIVVYSAEPYEGRHILVERKKEFSKYKEATKFFTELADLYAPHEVKIRIQREINRNDNAPIR